MAYAFTAGFGRKVEGSELTALLEAGWKLCPHCRWLYAVAVHGQHNECRHLPTHECKAGHPLGKGEFQADCEHCFTPRPELS